tara:strand:- start:5493 stop:6890 length:1398 start_codon:yes stop_codon:yes gene_type:complete
MSDISTIVRSYGGDQFIDEATLAACGRYQPTIAYPANNLIAQLGDSRTAQGGGGLPDAMLIAQPKSRAYGYQTHLQNYLHGRVRVPSTVNFGLSGDTSGPSGSNPGVTSRVANVIASGAATCIVLCSINDRGSEDRTAAFSIANLEYIVATLTAAGIWVILIPELFKGSASFPGLTLTGQQLQNQKDVFAWGMAQTGRVRVRVVDPRTLLLSNPTNWTWVDSATGDGLHEDLSGAKIIGYDVLGPQVADLFAQFPGKTFTTANLYDASTNPLGNLLANPLLTGTGGTANGNAGTWADNVTAITAPSGLTITGTAGATDPLGRTGCQRIQITGTPSSGTNPSFQFGISSATANILQGDKLSGYFEIYVAAATGVLSPANTVMRIVHNTGTPTPYFTQTNEQATNVQGFCDIAPYSWFAMIDEFTVQTGNTVSATSTYSITPQLLNGTACSLDIYIRTPFLGKNQYA